MSSVNESDCHGGGLPADYQCLVFAALSSVRLGAGSSALQVPLRSRVAEPCRLRLAARLRALFLKGYGYPIRPTSGPDVGGGASSVGESCADGLVSDRNAT